MSIKEIALAILDKQIFVKYIDDKTLSIFVSYNQNIEDILLSFDLEIKEQFRIDNCIQYVLIRTQ